MDINFQYKSNDKYLKYDGKNLKTNMNSKEILDAEKECNIRFPKISDRTTENT